MGVEKQWLAQSEWNNSGRAGEKQSGGIHIRGLVAACPWETVAGRIRLYRFIGLGD